MQVLWIWKRKLERIRKRNQFLHTSKERKLLTWVQTLAYVIDPTQFHNSTILIRTARIRNHGYENVHFIYERAMGSHIASITKPGLTAVLAQTQSPNTEDILDETEQIYQDCKGQDCQLQLYKNGLTCFQAYSFYWRQFCPESGPFLSAWLCDSTPWYILKDKLWYIIAVSRLGEMCEKQIAP